MIIPAICFIGGLVAMGRTKPKTGVRKLTCLGPRSGIVYPVEDFPEIGTVVVRAPNGAAVVQFIRAAVREPGKPGLLYQNGSGDPRMLELIRRDFGVEQKLAAVPAGGERGEDRRPSEMSPAAAALTPAQRSLYWSHLVYQAPETLTEDQKRITIAMQDEPDPQVAARAASSAAATSAAKPPARHPQAGRSTP